MESGPCNEHVSWVESITSDELDLDSINSLVVRFTVTLAEIANQARALLQREDLKRQAVGFARAAGTRLWELARRTAQTARGEADPHRRGYVNHFEPLYLMRNELRTKGGVPKRINEGRLASYRAKAHSIEAIFLEMEQAFDRAARGMVDVAFDRDNLGRTVPAPAFRIIVTGVDPFDASAPTSKLWSPSAAAMLALDGAGIGKRTYGIRTMIFPQSFTQFEGGDAPDCWQPSIVEQALRPYLNDVHAIITVSPGGGTFQIEPCAVGVQDNAGSCWDRVHAVASREGPTPFGRVPESRHPPGHRGSRGRLIYQEKKAEALGEYLESLARERQGNPHGIMRENQVRLKFSSVADCARAREALLKDGLPASALLTCGEVLALREYRAVEKVAVGSPLTDTAELVFTADGSTHHAIVEEGPGGAFLSNQISYRVHRLLDEQGLSSRVITFHVHTRSSSELPSPDSVIEGLELIVETLAEMYPP